MVYWIGAGILYVISLVVILRILKRSAIVRDNVYALDDAAQVQEGVTSSSEVEHSHIDKQLIMPRKNLQPGSSVSSI